MSRLTASALVLLLALSSSGTAQERVALFYALPNDGVWVEYEWRTGDAGSEREASSLRISSVGKTRVQDKPSRWIEIHKAERRADQTLHQLRKLLVVESAGAANQHAPFQILGAFAQNGLDGPVRRVNPDSIQKLVGLGFHGAEKSPAVVADNEEIRIGLGVFQAKHVTGRAKDGKRTLIYHAWIARDVPFGCAKFEIREAIGEGAERVLFTATAIKKGEAARSQLDDTKAPR